ncbi:polysaccharide biosynthesis tyrosine autokinase [Clavibacter tessellarius]|uniref:non-specific protein-tyrosine kinase n=1 Tax=Clavibacter tessellarius TaxID=31965 RepID=A0A225C4M8_9MICO|nr:polysaccharide biosynthesis tyrosine autokinase [Clavibacter michiganensis]OQJ61728.1 chromosome partitioning protein [Clavibacter michiganensis subsp. tessellarius]UKF32578.1 polysaccharide biosynthesis tyrosine autokinase [Clavibacter michiganensis subsp. tessellarius]
MELREYIRILRRSWILILLALLLGVGAAAGYSLVQTPEYRASAKVFVSTQSAGTVSDLSQGNSFTQQAVKSYADVVSTPVVLEPVIAQLGLDETAESLAPRVSASAAADTVIIEIAAQDEQAETAAVIANAVAKSFSDVVAQLVPEDTGGQPQVKITTLQEARIPASPVSPRVPLNLALGALVGLALGIAVSVLRSTLDTRIRGERDLRLVTDAPVLGGIAFDPKAKDRPLIVQSDPRSPRAESFRSLRTNLQFLDFGGRARSFVITSAVESEGKSTTTANLAIALSDAGARVAVIDADLRRPKLASYLGLEGAVGLTDVLIGRAKLTDVLQPWGNRNMFVLPAGQIPPNPSELLGSRTMVTLLKDLEAEFDTVLIDAPPLLPVTDSAVLSKSAGGAILVVSSGRAHRGQVHAAIESLNSVGAEVLGVVLTMLPTKGPDAYGYGQYGYSYVRPEGADGTSPAPA